jgi:hypothetical protein
VSEKISERVKSVGAGLFEFVSLVGEPGRALWVFVAWRMRVLGRVLCEPEVSSGSSAPGITQRLSNELAANKLKNSTKQTPIRTRGMTIPLRKCGAKSRLPCAAPKRASSPL